MHIAKRKILCVVKKSHAVKRSRTVTKSHQVKDEVGMLKPILDQTGSSQAEATYG